MTRLLNERTWLIACQLIIALVTVCLVAVTWALTGSMLSVGRVAIPFALALFQGMWDAFMRINLAQERASAAEVATQDVHHGRMPRRARARRSIGVYGQAVALLVASRIMIAVALIYFIGRTWSRTGSWIATLMIVALYALGLRLGMWGAVVYVSAARARMRKAAAGDQKPTRSGPASN